MRDPIIRHLSEEDLDRLLSEADDPKVVRRLTFVKNLYAGDTLEDAAARVGKSESTGSRWARRWNEGGLGQLTPNFGDGCPPKLGEDEQEQLVEMLREGQPWQPPEIQHLINEKFGVGYHPVYLSEFLKDLGLSYAIPRTKRPSRSDNAEETDEPHNKRENDDDEGSVDHIEKLTNLPVSAESVSAVAG